MEKDFSRKFLQKLGKRLRKNENDYQDIDDLSIYRRTFDNTLVKSGEMLNQYLIKNDNNFILSGRLKRNKSIIRKLIREPNMDLSRMSDIAGLRIIVKDIESQLQLSSVVENSMDTEKINNYVDTKNNYRAIHILGKYDNKPIEIQVRTLLQQLWAVESESYGEKVKEGSGDKSRLLYLKDLSDSIRSKETNKKNDFSKEHKKKFHKSLNYLLPYIENNFRTFINTPVSHSRFSFIIIHDIQTNEIIHKIKLSDNTRLDAVKEYERISKVLNNNNFNILLFNTNKEEALKVTHPNFFI